MQNACGKVKSLRRIQDIAKDFKTKERVSATRKEGSGRPQSLTNNENTEKVRKAIEEDNRLSLRGIAAITEINVSSVYRILTENLKFKSVFAKWIPHLLTEDHRRQRVQEAEHLLQNMKGSIVVVDEKWVYCDHLPCRQNNQLWVAPDGDRPTQPRRIISDQKFHIIVACNFRGDFRFHILERNQTINAQRYVEFLESILNMARPGRLELMHDNARPHTAVVTRDFCEQHGITLVKQPPYSPDMNLMDRFIFRNLEFDRRGTRFENKEHLTVYLENFLQNNMTKFKLAREMHCLKEHLQDVIDMEGNYV